MRTWLHLEELKRELHNLKIGILNNGDTDGKKAKQEWGQVRLSQQIPVQMKFRADYGRFCIEIAARNLGASGTASYIMDPEAITGPMLDDLGRFVIGRADKLPAAFTAVVSPRANSNYLLLSGWWRSALTIKANAGDDWRLG
jgi:hypothetical protein